MTAVTAARESQLIEAADLLLDARRTHTPIADLPAALRPTSIDEVYFVQDQLFEAFSTPGAHPGGYKIGAPTPEATPLFAPLPLAWIAPGGATLSGKQWRYRGLECEIAFQLGSDLPRRATPYAREEALAAIDSCHPVIEVIESGIEDPMAVDRMVMLADLQMHGGLIYGPPVPNWQSIDWTQERVALTVDGTVRVERTGSNTSRDFLKLIPWLANEGAYRTGGLHAGQWITTGSWTGVTLATAGSDIAAHFHTAGSTTLRFAPEAL